MSYNTDRRKPLVGRAREDFLVAHDYICHWCSEPIVPGLHQWDDDHLVPKELMPPGSDWNALSNRAPIHRDPCHKEKTAGDVKAIRKSNRIRRRHGPKEGRKKPAKPIPSRPFSKGHRPLRSANNLRRKSRG